MRRKKYVNLRAFAIRLAKEVFFGEEYFKDKGENFNDLLEKEREGSKGKVKITFASCKNKNDVVMWIAWSQDRG